MAGSIQKKVGRVRAPRVHITYDVEVGDSMEVKELPFVMGVLADFTGKPKDEQQPFKERKFTEVTPDNFDEVLERMQPHLNFTVDNKLTDEAGKKIAVDLSFKSLDDFSPDQVAQQVEPLKQLLDLRQQLADLRGSLQGNDRLEEILQATLTDEEKLKRLREELGSDTGGSDDEG